MKSVDPSAIKRAAQTWSDRCQHWGIRISAPFLLDALGESFGCIAFLPDFGGPKGMIIGAMDLPDIASDQLILDAAAQKGWFCSFINASAFSKKEIDDRYFKEALEDWGYYGPPDQCPKWLNRQTT